MAWVLTMGPQLGVAMDPFVGVLGQPGTITLRAIDNAGPVTWTLLSSTLPVEWDADLNIAGATATLTTADMQTPGEFVIRVRVVDHARQPIDAEFRVRVQALPITITGSLSEWTVGVAASDDLAVTGGSGTYVSAGIAAGSLPAGMGMSLIGSTIRVSGTPAAEGSGSVTIWVKDSDDAESTIALSWSATANVDPYWSNVVALMHFDGANNSTTFSDETGRVWTGSGNAKLSTAHSRWGVSSLDLDGSTGSYLVTASSADLSLSGQDATIEMSVRQRTVKPLATLVTKRPSASTTTEYSLTLTDGLPTISAWDAGNVVIHLVSSGPPLLPNVWYDIALSIVGTTWRLFVDGQKVAEGTPSGPVGTNNASVHFGRDPIFSDRNPDAYIDELRWTRGVGRYTSNYTPATGPFPSVGP